MKASNLQKTIIVSEIREFETLIKFSIKIIT